MEYDFRARLHIPLTHVGSKVSWGEAYRLIAVIRDDPSSALAAAMAGWPYSMSREALILADLIDVQGRSKAGRKWTTYPRPWSTERATTRKGNAAGRTRQQVLEILRSFGHS